MPIIKQGGIVRLIIVLDYMLFMSEAIVQALNNWLKQFPQEVTSKTVGENIARLMLQFMACSVSLSEVKNLKNEASTYLLGGITKCLVE